MTAEFLVGLYRLMHGKLRLPGAGWLIRRMIPFVPQLKNYQLKVPGIGVTSLDFRDLSSFGMLNFLVGDFGDDQQLIACLKRLIRPGDVFWDIGANLGYITMHLAGACPQISIHAFEPNPKALKTLQPLFSKSTHVRVHPIGLGERDEEMELRTLEGSTAWGTLTGRIDGGLVNRVQIRCGDNYRREQGIPAPNIIKIDVEGFEPHVLAGLRHTVEETRPAIVLEHIFLSDEQLRQLVLPNYLLRFIMEDGGLTADFATRMKGTNAILIDPQDSRGRDLGA